MVTRATVAKLRLDWLKRDCSQSRDSFSRFAVSRCFQSGNENLVAGSPFFPQPRSQGSLLPVATELERIWERPSHSRIAWLLATPPMESLLAAILNKINGKFRPLSPQLKMGKWRVLLFARLYPWFGAGGVWGFPVPFYRWTSPQRTLRGRRKWPLWSGNCLWKFDFKYQTRPR